MYTNIILKTKFCASTFIPNNVLVFSHGMKTQFFHINVKLKISPMHTSPSMQLNSYLIVNNSDSKIFLSINCIQHGLDISFNV